MPMDPSHFASILYIFLLAFEEITHDLSQKAKKLLVFKQIISICLERTSSLYLDIKRGVWKMDSHHFHILLYIPLPIFQFLVTPRGI